MHRLRRPLLLACATGLTVVHALESLGGGDYGRLSKRDDEPSSTVITPGNNGDQSVNVIQPKDNFWTAVKRFVPPGWHWSAGAVTGFGAVAVAISLVWVTVSIVLTTRYIGGIRAMLSAFGVTMVFVAGANVSIAFHEYRGIILLCLIMAAVGTGALYARYILAAASAGADTSTLLGANMLTALTYQPPPRPIMVDAKCSAIQWGAVCATGDADVDAGEVTQPATPLEGIPEEGVAVAPPSPNHASGASQRQIRGKTRSRGRSVTAADDAAPRATRRRT